MESRWSQMGRSKLRHYKDKTKAGLAIRKHLLDAGDVCFVDQGQLLELAHASGRFGTHQMALAGVAALDLAVGGELEALSGAAMRFQFQFWFRCVSRHYWKSSPDLMSTTSQGVFKVDLGANWGAACCAAKKTCLRVG